MLMVINVNEIHSHSGKSDYCIRCYIFCSPQLFNIRMLLLNNTIEIRSIKQRRINLHFALIFWRPIWIACMLRQNIRTNLIAM